MPLEVHGLRYVFATWHSSTPGSASKAFPAVLGHSPARVTQGISIHVRDDMYDRFFNATG